MERIETQIRAITARVSKKSVVFLLTSLAFLLMISSQACAIEGIPAYVQTPQSMVKWFQRDFTYAWTIPFSKKTAEEMVKSKMGACYDFAILACEVLSKLKISSAVVVIKFQGTRIGHAVCVWQGEDGTYNFISNKKMVYTGKKNIRDAILKYYPDTERFIIDTQKTI